MPKNSGPNSFAAEVKVLSRVDRDSVMKMMLVMEKVAVPKNLDTAVGLPASMLAKMACGTLHIYTRVLGLPNQKQRVEFFWAC